MGASMPRYWRFSSWSCASLLITTVRSHFRRGAGALQGCACRLLQYGRVDQALERLVDGNLDHGLLSEAALFTSGEALRLRGCSQRAGDGGVGILHAGV